MARRRGPWGACGCVLAACWLGLGLGLAGCGDDDAMEPMEADEGDAARPTEDRDAAATEVDAGTTPDPMGGSGTRLTEPLPPGDPIEVTEDEWTWVDFPETRCMNDSATGLGIRTNPASEDLLIVIQGGGACFNATTCLAAINPNGFNAAALPAVANVGLLNRDDPDNPFAGWNHVFIPYCSGDIFTGMSLDGTGFGGRTQAGYHNIRQYLTRLVPTFPAPARIVLSGYSAGGFAASFNWIQALEAWEGVRVDVLNDSGPPMGSDYLTPCLQKRLNELWTWEPSIPKDCTECNLETGEITEPVLRWSIPHTRQYRHGVISSTEDSIIKLFFAFGLNDCANIDALFATFPMGLYPQGLMALEATFADHPGAAAFVIDSSQHVWTGQSPGTVMSNGVVLRDWIEDFLDPEADFQSVTPF